jgi:hypothetical protein
VVPRGALRSRVSTFPLIIASSTMAEALAATENRGDGCPRCRELEQLVAILREQINVNNTPTKRPNSEKWTASDEKPFLQEYFEYRKSDFEREKGLCKLTIVRGSLVDAEEDYKVHLVSADMKRSRGVAVAFADAYGPVDMANHNFKVGDIHEQSKNGSTLLNLVHKDKYFFKFGYDPNAFLSNIVDALAKLKEYCIEKDIKRLALVRIAANTERVHWRWTQRKLLEIFKDVEITLAVYLHNPPRKFFHKTTSSPADSVVLDEVDDPATRLLLESAAKRLTNRVTGEKSGKLKGSVGGGSLPMLPLPNRKPPRHPLPPKVKESKGKKGGKANSSTSRRNLPKETEGATDGRTSHGGQIVVETRDMTPKRLSGGGGQSKLPSPLHEPPLTNTPKKVKSGVKSSRKANSLSSPCMPPADSTAAMFEVILQLREEMSKIRTDVADLRRSTTPAKSQRSYFPFSPASSMFITSRKKKKTSTQEQEQEQEQPKNTSSLISTK